MKARLLSALAVRRMVPRRPDSSHKGKNGHLLIIAGSRGMTGAAFLCALGALKAGAGLVTVGCGESVRKLIAARLPEAMTLPLPERKLGHLSASASRIIEDYVRRRTITVLAVGPGLSVHSSVGRLLRSLLRLPLPFVLDADGLNNLRISDIQGKSLVITPHPGEMARLLGVTLKVIGMDRSASAQHLACRAAITCVLKGHRTVITDGQRLSVNPTGNPAMATGGMGDVLTGVIGAFIAQGIPLYEAACAGVYLHGLAGDLAKTSDRGLLASELAMTITRALARLGIR